MKKSNILFISQLVPYDTVDHAGGKIHNYYLKELNKLLDCNIDLISFARKEEEEKIDLDKYNINYQVFFYENDFKSKIKRGFMNLPRKINFVSKYYGSMTSKFIEVNVIKALKKKKAKGYEPDIIVLEWTHIVLLAKKILKIYPNVKLIAVEHDVSYLGIERKLNLKKIKIFNKIRYNRFKKNEISNLRLCSLVLTLNVKDMKLLEKELNSTKLDYITPYYTLPKNEFNIKKKVDNYDIVFYGAMSRPENYLSCIWFIENVFNKLIEIDKRFKFIIVGSRPHEKLKKYESENIILTGFVDDVAPYIQNSMCVVAPLVLGAGIKIKVLEAMAAGALVLTNNIGIEGIPATNMKDYINCETPEEYLDNILKISNGEIDTENIIISSKKNLESNFSLTSSLEKYRKYILSLLQ